jgi:hypothetical protein
MGRWTVVLWSLAESIMGFLLWQFFASVNVDFCLTRLMDTQFISFNRGERLWGCGD